MIPVIHSKATREASIAVAGALPESRVFRVEKGLAGIGEPASFALTLSTTSIMPVAVPQISRTVEPIGKPAQPASPNIIPIAEAFAFIGEFRMTATILLRSLLLTLSVTFIVPFVVVLFPYL
jgi:hypothetical protein